MVMVREPQRPGRRAFKIGDRAYPLIDEERVQGPARAWAIEWASDQPALPEPFEFELGNQALGAGITFADAPGSYEFANLFDFTPMGMVTWPIPHTLEPFFTATVSRQERIFVYGTSVYVATQRYVLRYTIDPAVAEWKINCIHYLGASKANTGGRIVAYDNVIYFPVIDTSTGLPDIFQAITVPYGGAPTVEVQTIAISGSPTGGTYTITFDDGFGARTTAPIAWNAPSSTVEAALQLVPGLERVTVSQSGSSPNFTHTVTMTAAPALAGSASPPQFTSSAAGLTGGAPVITHATTVAGATDTWALGPAARTAHAFVVQESALVRGSGNVVAKALSNPMVAGNWGAEYEVGEATAPITDLAVYPGGELVVGKTDGPWLFNASSVGEPGIPELAGVVAPSNCLGMEYAQGYVLIPHLNGLIRYRPGAWSLLGIEQDELFEPTISSGGWGRISGIASWGRRTYYLSTPSSTSAATNYLPLLMSMAPGGPRAGGVTLHMHRRAASTRTYAGLATGVSTTGIGYLIAAQRFSGFTQGEVFSLGEGPSIPGLDPTIAKGPGLGAEYISSRYFAPNRRVQKTYLELEFYAEIVGSGSSLQFLASVDGASYFSLLDSPSGSAANITTTGRHRVYFPASTLAVGRDVQIKVQVAWSSGAASLRVRDMALRGVYDPRAVEVISAFVAVEPGTPDDSGVADGRTMEKILSDLRSLIGGDGQLPSQIQTITDPLGRTGWVKVLSVKESEVIYKGSAKPVLAAQVLLRKVLS